MGASLMDLRIRWLCQRTTKTHLVPSSSSKWPSRIKKSRQKTSFPHSTKGYYQNRAFELDWLCSHISYWSCSPAADPLGAGRLDGGQCPWDAAHHAPQGGGPGFFLSRKLTNLVWVTNPAMYWVFESWQQSRGYFIVTKPPNKTESCHQEEVSLPLALLLNFPSAGVTITCFSYFSTFSSNPMISSYEMVLADVIKSTSHVSSQMCRFSVVEYGN